MHSLPLASSQRLDFQRLDLFILAFLVLDHHWVIIKDRIISNIELSRTLDHLKQSTGKALKRKDFEKDFGSK